MYRIEVVKLQEGAWFGDYQIMVNMKSTWELVASQGSKEKSGSTGRIGKGKVQVFELDKHKFTEIYNMYPEYRRFIFLRANLRRTHWLKVFEENRHHWLLEKKVEEQKRINTILGYENRNHIFDYEGEHDFYVEEIKTQLKS